MTRDAVQQGQLWPLCGWDGWSSGWRTQDSDGGRRVAGRGSPQVAEGAGGGEGGNGLSQLQEMPAGGGAAGGGNPGSEGPGRGRPSVWGAGDRGVWDPPALEAEGGWRRGQGRVGVGGTQTSGSSKGGPEGKPRRAASLGGESGRRTWEPVAVLRVPRRRRGPAATSLGIGPDPGGSHRAPASSCLV